MFIEIKDIKKAKQFLELKYSSTSKNEIFEIKYNHLIDCLNILKFYGYLNYLNYGASILLHDIGRFYEFKNKKIDHAKYGYNLLKQEFTNNPIILLPIKYHENDLEWQQLLLNDKEFLCCSKHNKSKIIKCCKLVRDIDIISNMKYLASKEYHNQKINHINKKIIDKLYSNDISIKEEIYNEYDKISYILCGLNLISYKRSFKYLKKYKVIELLMQKQLNIINNKELYDYTTKTYKYIKRKFQL